MHPRQDRPCHARVITTGVFPLIAGLCVFSPCTTAHAQSAPMAGTAGSFAFETAVGRGLVFAKSLTGRTSGTVAEPLVTRLGAAFSLGGGVSLEGALRGSLDPSLAGVRSLAVLAGLRIDTDRTSVLSLSLRLGWDGLLAGSLSHGTYVSAGLNVRPWRAVVFFAEGLAEAWPGATMERSTANDRAGDHYVVLAAVSYLGGIRLSL